MKCKHIYAVEYTSRREIATTTTPDGATTVIETVIKTKKVTYKQNWTAYNAAQTHEGERFVELLSGLCAGIVQPPQTMGRPRLPLADVVFASVLKVYTTMSGRRATSDIEACRKSGAMTKPPHYNSMFRYLEDTSMTAILTAMIEESASPLKLLETDFAVDSSGFSTCRYERWYDAKYGKEMSKQTWLKAHLMCGVRTHIVTSVEVTDQNSNDSPHLPALLKTTTKRFKPNEVSGDKGYISHGNLQAIVDAGATPYIPFKKNTTGEGPELWRKLYGYYMQHRSEFLQHYHKRSNVETVFSMIKAKFGDALRSKSDTAQVNEALCKVLCHNIYVLIQSIYELGIEPVFWQDAPTELHAVAV
jgi:transposase